MIIPSADYLFWDRCALCGGVFWTGGPGSAEIRNAKWHDPPHGTVNCAAPAGTEMCKCSPVDPGAIKNQMIDRLRGEVDR